MRPWPFLWLPLLAACSGESTSTPSGDATTDVVADAPPVDTQVIDSVPGDSTAPDSSADSSADVVVPETGVALSAECSAAGGLLCTDFRWTICPKGFEPVSSADHFACGTAGGWCCRPAPVSPCAASGIGNCIPTCPLDCWQPVTDTALTCDGTKKCCRDVCK